MGFTSVHLHIPGIDGMCITCGTYFMPYLACLLVLSEGTAPPKWNYRHSSTVMWGHGLQRKGNRWTHLSHTSCIAASLSCSHPPCLVSLSSKPMTREKAWNVFRDMMVGIIDLPVPAFQRLAVAYPFDLYTSAKISNPM